MRTRLGPTTVVTLTISLTLTRTLALTRTLTLTLTRTLTLAAPTSCRLSSLCSYLDTFGHINEVATACLCSLRDSNPSRPPSPTLIVWRGRLDPPAPPVPAVSAPNQCPDVTVTSPM